jgi:hypothetical protein
VNVARWNIPKAAAVAGLIGGLLACSDAESRTELDQERAETRAIMQNMLESLRDVLPLSVERSALSAPENAEKVRASLDAFSNNASLVSDHMATRQTSMRTLSRNLERDAAALSASFQAGQVERTGFLLRQITENCVVCHSRLPSPGDSPLAEHFIDERVLQSLPPERRATLQIATRRFDDALVTLEQILARPSSPALMIGPLTDYLTVSIRVKGDFERPIQPLTKFAAREGLWERLRMDVDQWLNALPRMEQRAAGEATLAAARAILDDGQQIAMRGGDRAALVHNITASALLERFIEGRAEAGLDVAEAYYLLGLTESMIGRNYWVTQGPLFLETAIRIAPSSRFAPDAFAMLEEQLLMSYEGSEYEELPEDEMAHLAELRALMQQAAKNP